MKPIYGKASVTGDSLTLENGRIRAVLWKRLCGWGFGEIYNQKGRLMGVLDHFGELKIRDQEIPMRLEADRYEYVRDGENEAYTFFVKTTMPAEKLQGTSFEPWVRFPFRDPVLEGTVRISLNKGDSGIGIQTELEAKANIYADYLRFLWLLAGEGAFGGSKTDALLPGVDWPVGKEWSSGTDFFKEPWANRCVPHPNKVGIPVLAVSEGGDGIGVSYSLDAPVSRWFNYGEYYTQPVFACPNFIDRRDNNLLGLMIPDVKADSCENKPFGSEPMEIHVGQRFSFSARIFAFEGTSCCALTEFVRKNGFPEPKQLLSYGEGIEKIARAFNSNLWHPGEGFGYRQGNHDAVGTGVPGFLRRFVRENPENPLSEELREKIRWCDLARKVRDPSSEEEELNRARAKGDTVLSWQKEDGSFRFEPEGRHYSKDDFRVARAFIEPMGTDGDTALYMNTEPASTLLDVYEKTKDGKYLDGAIRALDFCEPMWRPEGGDYWETPLHAPNLLAAGSAVCTYYRAYRITGNGKYREKAVWYLRSLLAFTHLREPKNVKSLYNTKPCLCSSDWYFANWVRDFVQWEVLQSFNRAESYGFSWEEIDPELDWKTYEKGIVTALFRWMPDYEALNWRPHNIPGSLDNYLEGQYAATFSDTFNSVTGNIGGMVIDPSSLAGALYRLMDKE